MAADGLDVIKDTGQFDEAMRDNLAVVPIAADDIAAVEQDQQAIEAENDEPPKGFLKLPPEIRVKIYQLLLLPPAIPRVECSDNPTIKTCTPGGRLLASTCKPIPTTIRTLDCSRCDFRGADVHTSILAVNRQIFDEASAVLYENVRIVQRDRTMLFGTGSASQKVLLSESGTLAPHIQHFQLSLTTADRHMAHETCQTHQSVHWRTIASLSANCVKDMLPGIKHITLHFDVDLTVCENLDATPFHPFTNLDQADYLVEVHVIRAFEGDEDWAEVIDSRPKEKKAARKLDEKAEQLRADFVKDLRELFEKAGKELKIREV